MTETKPHSPPADPELMGPQRHRPRPVETKPHSARLYLQGVDHAHPVHEWDGHPEPRSWPLALLIAAGIVAAIVGWVAIILAIALLGD
jgi:hypothetical protein